MRTSEIPGTFRGSGILLKTNRSAAARRFAAVLLLLCCALLSALLRPSSAEETARRNTLRTSYNPEAYAAFEISGNTVSAAGVFRGDRLRRISVLHGGISSMKFSADAQGGFTASFTLEQGTGADMLTLEFESGAKTRFRIHGDGAGWYFPDNGLSQKNREVFDSIYDAPDEAALLYLTASGDATRAESVRDQLRRISDSVTEDMTDDYEKARALCAYVADHFYYDRDARENSVTEETIVLENVLKSVRTVCSGFANLYCALLQAQGIDAVAVKGGVAAGGVTYSKLTDGLQNHEFTAFWYEKEQRWVWADPCWCGSGNYKNGEYLSDLRHEKYFDISDEALALDHRADYAERRSFFTVGSEKPEMAETESSPALQIAETTADEPIPETSSETVPDLTKTEETEASEAEMPEKAAAPEAPQDNTSLITLAAVLDAAVLVLGIRVIFQMKQKK